MQLGELRIAEGDLRRPLGELARERIGDEGRRRRWRLSGGGGGRDGEREQRECGKAEGDGA